ncbi:hypothetical protein QM306_40685, partial [Burkholderia cenocepacia]|nr:hypothetical protein [Burkholderia cenocepacia]
RASAAAEVDGVAEVAEFAIAGPGAAAHTDDASHANPATCGAAHFSGRRTNGLPSGCRACRPPRTGSGRRRIDLLWRRAVRGDGIGERRELREQRRGER